ncbi:MAG: magnesium/cobalt transporter CorA [Patescibacteria group bacterium]
MKLELKKILRLKKKVGQPPGTVEYTGRERNERPKITVIDYNTDNFSEKEVAQIEKVFPHKETETTTWINIDGIHNVELIKKIGQHFELHSLTLEDIVNTDQRPKLEDMEQYIFIVLKMMDFDPGQIKVANEQVSLILGRNYVISFQEKEGDLFDPIRDRILHNKGRIRKMGSDYLIYALIDVIVDHYFVILEKLGEKTDNLEEELLTNPSPKILDTIHNMKRTAIDLRKTIWPVREIINKLERGEIDLIKKETIIYLRDVYDHTIQIIEAIESSRDVLSGMLDIYLSSVSNRMNEVMKVLTIIATIFIPMTFIAGVYGMNFKNMPELEWPLGYFSAWGIMLTIAVIMMIYFKRKKWF